MPKPTIEHVLKTLDSICHRMYIDPTSMSSHMSELSALLGEYDREDSAKYCWLEASIRQAQLNHFTKYSELKGEAPLLCLLKVQGQNAYNLCFAKDVDQCVFGLRTLCKKPIELVAYGRAKLIPDSLRQVLSDPQIQKNRWFPLTDIQRKSVVRTLKLKESTVLH